MQWLTSTAFFMTYCMISAGWSTSTAAFFSVDSRQPFSSRPMIVRDTPDLKGWVYAFGAQVKGHFGILVSALGPRPIYSRYKITAKRDPTFLLAVKMQSQ